MNPKWDPTINFGHVIIVFGFLGAMSGFYYLTDYRVSALERNLEKLSTVVIDNARTDERLKDYARRLEKIESRLP